LFLEDKPAVLARVAGTFAGRGVNIGSLRVSPLPDAGLSEMRIVAQAPACMMDLIARRVHRVVSVLALTVELESTTARGRTLSGQDPDHLVGSRFAVADPTETAEWF
jgi:acetolactate synthase I/III small subunit